MVSAISSPSDATAFLNSSKAIASRRFLAIPVLSARPAGARTDTGNSASPRPAVATLGPPSLHAPGRPMVGGLSQQGRRRTPMTQTNQLSGAEAFVRMLQAHEVKYIFGLCGDTSLPLYDALYRL